MHDCTLSKLFQLTFGILVLNLEIEQKPTIGLHLLLPENEKFPFSSKSKIGITVKEMNCLRRLQSGVKDVWINLTFANLPGTYFNCIMFMVASSVVTTIMILNYHHRLADTHEMPGWVSSESRNKEIKSIK